MTRSPGELVVEDVDGPRRARPGHVIVRPEAVGICGSDFHLFSGDLAALSGASDFYPRVQGHEVAAIVEDPGDSAHQGGDRVAIWPLLACGHCYPCRTSRPNVCPSFRLVGVHLDGGLQERLEVPVEQVFQVGDLDADCASFVEPASVAVHALARGQLQAGEKTVIFGAGPIGLAVLAAAARQGARVMSVDPLASRRDLAGRLGAEAVTWSHDPGDLITAVRDWTQGEGPPLVVDTSGATSVLNLATEIVAPAGRIVVVGMSSGAAPVRPGIFPEKEIDVLGSSTATAADFRDAISLVTTARENISKLFSHHFPLARAAEAFEFAMSRPPDAVKIVVNVN
ncbi:MAG TPA: zinc-binding dehydrogenase [Streptosporangiaceae bacterium]|nr:zinc-binding dehydrogenase [Streptosporangiaceae bacterium]